MKINRNHAKLFGIYTLCLSFILLNTGYFEYAANGQPDESQFPFLVKLILGDSVLYYRRNPEIMRVVFDGLENGEVMPGSIFSLIGISTIVGALHLIPTPIYLTWALFAILLFELTISVLGSREYLNSKYKAASLFLPLPLYLIAPNKELFSVILLLAIPSSKNGFQIILIGLILGAIREAYLVIAAFYYVSSFIRNGWRLYIYIYFLTVLLSFMLPNQYFEEITLADSQLSGPITEMSLKFISTGILSILGIIMKISIGLIGPIINLPIKLQNGDFLAIVYGITSICIINTAIQIVRTRHCVSRPVPPSDLMQRVFRLLIIYAIVMSLAPGNPARFLMPLLFPLLWLKLLHKTNRGLWQRAS